MLTAHPYVRLPANVVGRQLDDLCYIYLDFCFDFPIQITEKYSIVLC